MLAEEGQELEAVLGFGQVGQASGGLGGEGGCGGVGDLDVADLFRGDLGGGLALAGGGEGGRVRAEPEGTAVMAQRVSLWAV